jgi:hypothetical protein
MPANPKASDGQEAASDYQPTSSRRPANRDALRTLRYDFQVDGGEDYLEDMSWKPFANLKRRRVAPQVGSRAAPPRADAGGGRGGKQSM